MCARGGVEFLAFFRGWEFFGGILVLKLRFYFGRSEK